MDITKFVKSMVPVLAAIAVWDMFLRDIVNR